MDSKQQKIFIQRDTYEVELAFNRLPRYWRAGMWLDPHSKYKKDCINQLRSDFDTRQARHKISHKDLSEYISSSSIVHCFDGWAYLGRAINALLVGDHDAARHLGYYAELRSAMSILASSGIGVFNDKHVAVSKGPKCLCISGLRTHAFVWEALKEWGKDLGAANLMLSMISGGGCSLDVWLKQAALTPAFMAAGANDWLLDWGLDLSRMTDDQKARNLSSYRPTALSTSRPLDVDTVLKFVSALWRLCQPTAESYFMPLDQVLIASSLRRVFRSRTPKNRISEAEFSRFIEGILTALGFNERSRRDWVKILTKEVDKKFDILSIAEGKDDPSSANHVIQVISRAFLLSRIATGTSERMLFRMPGSARNKLDFWIDEVGEDRALWAQNEKPGSMLDLWTETEDAVSRIQQNSSQIDSFHAVWQKFPYEAGILSSCERVTLWGLGL